MSDFLNYSAPRFRGGFMEVLESVVNFEMWFTLSSLHGSHIRFPDPHDGKSNPQVRHFRLSKGSTSKIVRITLSLDLELNFLSR